VYRLVKEQGGYRLNSIPKVELVTKDGYAVLKSAIIVDRFEDQIIENALNKILENIEDYGTKVGS
jgi:hypothetical protein